MRKLQIVVPGGRPIATIVMVVSAMWRGKHGWAEDGGRNMAAALGERERSQVG